MVTLRTPKVWPRRAARWFCERVHVQFVRGASSEPKRKRSQATGAGLVLAVLIGLTTLAVAWVGVWWVPAYLALMVCIFVIPHGHGEPERVSVSDEESTAESCADLGQGLRVDHVNDAATNHIASGLISGLTTSESAAEAEVSHLDLASSGKARARRTRGRARKAAQTSTGNAPGSASVTWIRVGPGKFVRAEGGNEAVDRTQGDIDSTNDHTIVSGPVRDLPVSLPIDDALVEGDDSLESPVVNSDDQGGFGGSDDSVTGSVTEVYGIAPSTFDSIRSDSPSVEDLGPDVADAGVIMDADCCPAPELSNDLAVPRRQAANSGGRISGTRLYRSSRRIINTIRRGDRASSQCTARSGPEVRSPIRSFSRPNGRLQQTFRRTFGRVSHIQRALRPRSPPFS
jgi:hypothetical protein